MSGISCVVISSGRIDQLQSSIASFLSQDYHDKELLVVSKCFRQKLQGDLQNVKFINSGQMIMDMRCKNLAIEHSKFDTICVWSELDHYLPHHLSRVAEKISGRQWIWFEREWHSEHRRHLKAEQGSESVFAFTKEAWQKVGGYKPGVNGADDRNFIARVTAECDGSKIPTSQGEITFVRVGSEVERTNTRPSIRSGNIKIEPLATRDFKSQIAQFLTGRVENKLAVVMLGRFGDLINLLPYLKLIADNYEKPTVVVSQEFADLFDGVSYVRVHPLAIKNEELGQALRIAKEEFQIVINAQIWGRGWSQKRLTPAYNMESWNNCGILHRWNDKSLYPIFDKRDNEREAELIKSAIGENQKGRPIILVNVSKAVSSPCPQCEPVLTEIQKLWGIDNLVIDISQVRAHRIYDMLGLFEMASVLVCLDSAYIHLAQATEISIVSVKNHKPWAGTVVRRNQVAETDYEKLDMAAIHEGIAAGLNKGTTPLRAMPIQQCRPVAGRVFNLIDKFEDTDEKAIARKSHAVKSQDDLYEKNQMIPIHVWEYPRTADKTLGDPRKLPYLKDLFKRFLEDSWPEDVCIWSNDDTLLNGRIVEYSKFHASVYGACSFFRSEFGNSPPSPDMAPEEWARMSRGRHIGRDAFAFSHKWLVEHWDTIPDFCIGASGWDLCFAALIRLTYGIKTTGANLGENIFPAEAPDGLVGHVAHHSLWNLDSTRQSPSNAWNGRLFREWSEKNGLELKFTEENNLAVK